MIRDSWYPPLSDFAQARFSQTSQLLVEFNHNCSTRWSWLLTISTQDNARPLLCHQYYWWCLGWKALLRIGFRQTLNAFVCIYGKSTKSSRAAFAKSLVELWLLDCGGQVAFFSLSVWSLNSVIVSALPCSCDLQSSYGSKYGATRGRAYDGTRSWGWKEETGTSVTSREASGAKYRTGKSPC